MARLYSYYADVPELNRMDELRLSVLWRQRWTAAGWEPVILSEWQSRKHPMFANLDAAVSKLPTVNPISYELACWHRWAALAYVGGGWMSDLDVMPYKGQPQFLEICKEGRGADLSKLLILQVPCCPGLVYCSKENAERLCQEFSKGIGQQDQAGGRTHFSDQYALASLVEQKVDWIERRDVVKDYTDTGWENAPVVHFPNRVMAEKKLTPRWSHIPKLLDA